MSIKFLVLGGGGYFGFWGGGGADLIFMGARIFLRDSLAVSRNTGPLRVGGVIGWVAPS